MSASAPIFERTWSVGKNFKVTLSVPPVTPGKPICATMEWDPCMPKKKLSKSEMDDYYAGRNMAMIDMSIQTGIKGMVIDL